MFNLLWLKDGYFNILFKSTWRPRVDRIKLLESNRRKIFTEREEKQRLKSREIWLETEDENSKFSQNYNKGRKNINTIWGLKLEEGNITNSFEDLSLLGRNHFKILFKAPIEVSIAEVIRVAKNSKGI